MTNTRHSRRWSSASPAPDPRRSRRWISLALRRRAVRAIAGITYDLAAEPKPRFSPLVLELVKAGRTVEAIKAYRDDTGAGMKEAKVAIDELARS